MPRRLLAAALVVVCAFPAFAGRRARTRECKEACVATIQQCVGAGGRLRKCKRQVVRHCRREGIAVCDASRTYAVAPSGVDAVDCGTPEAPCRTIQFVVEALVPFGGGGTIKVAVGTYDDLETCFGGLPNQAVVCFFDKQITLVGGFIPPVWDAPTADSSATVIDGGGQGRGVRIARSGPNEPTASLEMVGLTIQNGVAQGSTSGDLTETSASGGGLIAESAAVTLRDVAFRNNRAIGGTTRQGDGGRGAGGALAVYNVWPDAVPPATLFQVTFEGNQAHGGDGGDVGGYALGGAMFAYSIAVSGDGLVFTDNTAVAGSTSGTGSNGTDKADALGGAFAVGVNGSADLRHVQASGNLALGGDAANGEAGGAFGGAFFAELGALTITDAVIEDNRAQGGAGRNTTSTASLAQAGGLFATMSWLTVDRAIVIDNEARAGDGVMHGGIAEGGGVAVTLGSQDGVQTQFTIRNSVVANNFVGPGSGMLEGGGGGGLFVQGAAGTVEHATVADNRVGAPHLVGSGITLFALPGWPTHVTVSDSILANHTTPAACHADAALWVAQNTMVDATRVLFANNVRDTNDAVWGCNVSPGTVTMAGVLTAPDAGFVSAGSPDHDYHLTAASPAVDQASGATVTVDLDGTARPHGALPDLGAYEFTP